MDTDDQSKDTPAKRYAYWSAELSASMKARKKWWKQGDKIVTRYKGGKVSNDNGLSDDGFRLNLFHSNTKTLENMLYGNTPKIDVSRRYQQADDDAGRVAAEMMERLLNLDVAENGAEMDAVLRSTLQDRLLAGLGCAKVRYEADIQDDQLISESAPIEYHYWGDLLWSWGRNWADLRWLAFRHFVAKDEAAKRWGEEAAADMNFKKQTEGTSEDKTGDTDEDSAWLRAEVWEIWDKDTRKVRWLSMGYAKELEEKADPLQLSGFWPTPPFLMANATTSLYTPTPDYVIAQDLYNEIDVLQTRISIITTAVKVAGVYNASADNLKRLISEGMDNTLIPVENWALFGENGGVAGQIEWMPLDAITSTLRELIGIRDQTIGLLQQTTGMTDVMRGALDNQYEGVGQTEQKTKFGSVRIQALQEQFARFAGDLMQLKAEVISRHFSPETIVQQANMRFSTDAELVPAAVELLKNPKEARIRVNIRPESIAMIDYQAIKGERTEYLNALSTYMQSSSAILSEDPSAKPFVLQLLQWGLAGFKGSSEIEGVIDKAIAASQKAAEQQGQEQPSEAQIQAQAAERLEQLKQQGEQAKIQAKTQADMALLNTTMQNEAQMLHLSTQAKLTELSAQAQAKATEIQMALEADLLTEQAATQANVTQMQASVEGEIQKDVVNHQISMQAEAVKTRARMAEILADAQATIEVEKAKPKPTIKGGSDGKD